MGLQSITMQDIVIDKDREDPLEHFGVYYRKKMKTSHTDRITPDR